MNLSPYKLRKIREILKRHSDVMLELLVGRKPSDLAKKLGISTKSLDMIGYGYTYGKLEAMTGLDLTKVPLKDINKFVAGVNLTKRQTDMLNLLRNKAGSYANTFGDRLATEVVAALTASAAASYGDNTAQQVSKVMKELRQSTKDYARDWHRIIQTETWDAKLQGEANAIADRNGPYSGKGQDTLVFKRPAWNACKECIRLYLEPDGITPRVFKLSEMQACGTNIGRKTKNWQPVLGTMHPYCQCTLNTFPEGYKFDQSGQLVPDVKGLL